MNTIKSWLAAIVTIGFLGALFVLFQVSLPESSKDILLVLIGCLTGIVKDVYSYYFGSSEGSARKTELMSASPASPITPPLTIGSGKDMESGFIRLRLLLTIMAVFLVMGFLAGCVSSNISICASGSEGKQTVKATDSDSPTTRVDTQATIPLR